MFFRSPNYAKISIYPFHPTSGLRKYPVVVPPFLSPQRAERSRQIDRRRPFCQSRFLSRRSAMGRLRLLAHRPIHRSHHLFCVEPKLRDKGYGSRILQTIQTAHPDQAILVDIETIHEHIDNREQRVRRKAFYLRNGYQETNIQYTWQNESYEILSAQKTITPDDFQRFWGTLYQNGFEGY